MRRDKTGLPITDMASFGMGIKFVLIFEYILLLVEISKIAFLFAEDFSKPLMISFYKAYLFDNTTQIQRSVFDDQLLRGGLPANAEHSRQFYEHAEYFYRLLFIGYCGTYFFLFMAFLVALGFSARLSSAAYLSTICFVNLIATLFLRNGINKRNIESLGAWINTHLIFVIMNVPCMTALIFFNPPMYTGMTKDIIYQSYRIITLAIVCQARNELKTQDIIQVHAPEL